MKIYQIGPEKFRLKEYGDLTGFEEEKINLLFSQQAVPSQAAADNQLQLSVTGYEIFTVILTAENPDVDVNSFDWRHLKNKQIAQILVDFAVEKKTSQDSLTDYMTQLIEQKMRQYGNLKTNTEKQKASGSNPVSIQGEKTKNIT